MKPIASAIALLGLFFALSGCEDTLTEVDASTEVEVAPIIASPRTIEFESYTELDTLFVELGYTQARWQDGIREVPRVYLSSIPERWRSSTSKTVTVQKKKELFFRLLGPLVLRANELVEVERAWLLEQEGAPLGSRLQSLYKDYRVEEGKFEALLIRVDSVPVSLVLAQAAEESGWGTSRFAALGNALFGQWTFGKGMAPLHRREEKGDYSIAAFESLLDSVVAYMRNINSHPAYRELRRVRANDRRNATASSGHELAKTLTSYSERGEDYIHSLHTIMRVNSLGATDSAYLADGVAIVLVPVSQ
jgi:Bax protein